MTLSCTCSLAREDVSYSILWGAIAPWLAQRRLSISACAPSVRQLNKSLLFCVWRIPFQLPTMHAHAAHTFMPTCIRHPHMGRTLATLGGGGCKGVRGNKTTAQPITRSHRSPAHRNTGSFVFRTPVPTQKSTGSTPQDSWTRNGHQRPQPCPEPKENAWGTGYFFVVSKCCFAGQMTPQTILCDAPLKGETHPKNLLGLPQVECLPGALLFY